MESLVQNCDILFHECSYGPILMDMERDVLTMEDYDYDELERKMLQQAPYKARWDKIEAAAILWRHSTAEMAGSYATKVKAKKLVIFHLGARYDVRNYKNAEKINQMLRNRVARFYDGSIEVAYDGITVLV